MIDKCQPSVGYIVQLTVTTRSEKDVTTAINDVITSTGLQTLCTIVDRKILSTEVMIVEESTKARTRTKKTKTKKHQKSKRKMNKTKKKEKTKTPKEKTKTPKEKTKTPKEKTKIPKEKTKTPKEKTKTPKEKTKTPKEKTKIPKEKTKTPKEKTKTPKEKTKTPKEKTKTPKEKTKRVYQKTIFAKVLATCDFCSHWTTGTPSSISANDFAATLARNFAITSGPNYYCHKSVVESKERTCGKFLNYMLAVKFPLQIVHQDVKEPIITYNK